MLSSAVRRIGFSTYDAIDRLPDLISALTTRPGRSRKPRFTMVPGLSVRTVSIGGSTSGSIETTGDTDWFRVMLTAGHTYQFDLQGAPTGHGTLADPCMWLLDGAGNNVAYNDDKSASIWDSQIVYTPTVTGYYFLDVGSRGGPGTYLVSASAPGG